MKYTVNKHFKILLKIYISFSTFKEKAQQFIIQQYYKFV